MKIHTERLFFVQFFVQKTGQKNEFTLNITSQGIIFWVNQIFSPS